MISRVLFIQNDYSFLLFGPRGAGKSTLIRSAFATRARLWIDLLDPDEEAVFQTTPNVLAERCAGFTKGDLIIIDEVQKAPKLLDIVHRLIENQGLLFGLTGSSARKLKRGAANLLAGRAFTYSLFPFSVVELRGEVALDHALNWGLMPKTLEFSDDQGKKKFLRSYANTYLKEEVQMEQLVRNIPMFRRFLPVASQMHTKILNYSSIARDIGSDHVTISNYFDILEDTLIGFRLPAFERSIRKQQSKSSKFYFIDNGIARAIGMQLENICQPGSYAYGIAFEGFIVSEIYKLAHYRDKDEKLSYLLTKDGAKVDLVIEKPDGQILFLEIKSTNLVHHEDLTNLIALAKSDVKIKPYALSNERNRKMIGNVECMHWLEFLNDFWQS